LHLNYFGKTLEVFKGCKNQGLYIFLASGGGAGLVCGEVSGVSVENIIMPDLRHDMGF